MITFYCPNCWNRIEENIDTCPFCGFNLADFIQLTYEEKLIQSLHHPVPSRRNIAAQVLGNNNSIKALDEFEKILLSGETDYFFLRVVLLAIAKIKSTKSLELLKLAETNPNALVREWASTLFDSVVNGLPIPEWDRGTG